LLVTMGKKKVAEEVVVKEPVVETKAEDESEEDTPVIKSLKAIDDKYCALQRQFEHEVEMLRKKCYNERQAPILTERAKVLAGGPDSPNDLCGTPACKGFWLQAFQNADIFAEILEEWDDPVLQFLQDIKKTDLDDTLPEKGFKVDFIFKENPYFTNTSLWVEFHIEFDMDTYKPYLEHDCAEVKCCEIAWKPGQNVTVELTTKKQKGGGAKKAKQKAKAKEEPRASFFRFLFRPLKLGDPPPPGMVESLEMGEAELDDDDMEGIVKMFLGQMHEVGHTIAEEIIPYAVRFYTGEIGDGDDEDDDEEEEEDSDDEDDDEEEESDEEPPPPKKGGKKGGKKDAPGKPAEGGKKEEECKQQ